MPDPEDTRTGTMARELTQTARHSEETTALDQEHRALQLQEHQPQCAEASEQAAVQAETLPYHAVHPHHDLPALHVADRQLIEDLHRQHLHLAQ